MRLIPLLIAGAALLRAQELDLTQSVIVAPAGAEVPAQVLKEELARRANTPLSVAPTSSSARRIEFQLTSAPGEGFRIQTTANANRWTIRIEAGSRRGLLYGAGHLLRQLDWAPGRLRLAAPLNLQSAPRYPIRGHQLGYRATANTYDAWTIAQYDQYIRDLALFGVNAIESIPFQDERHNPVMKVERRAMDRAMGEICQKYGIEYWAWLPATIDLNDAAKREALLQQLDNFLSNTPIFHGMFFPGGDPGHNPADAVLRYLEQAAARLAKRHPQARIWLSMQGFKPDQTEVVYRYLARGVPAWFGGLVVGPSSPPIAEMRTRLPKGTRVRLYPDLTHNKISQFEVPEWDQAYALTLGREAINPRPAEYTAIFHRYAPQSDGFISYSDGSHDDVNKIVWSALAWDPTRTPRDILIEYVRFHFHAPQAVPLADAIFALERNWRGPLADNGGVEATLLQWRQLEQQHPQLASNWRWQMLLFRAHYDAYVRRRLLRETAVERQVNAVLLDAARTGPVAAIDKAQALLAGPLAAQDLRARIEAFAEQLYQSIGLQSSVPKYHASGAERGAVLDFLDLPLNNRFWLEDEFAKVRALASRDAQIARLTAIANWENPGEGSFYDDIGHIARSPHVPRDETNEPLFWWLDSGRNRGRLSWQVTMWPARMVYEGLDPSARYVVRTLGLGQTLLKVNGARIPPRIDNRELNTFKEFDLPPSAYASGRLTLHFDVPTDEEHLNWRQQSRLAEVWLLKR